MQARALLIATLFLSALTPRAYAQARFGDSVGSPITVGQAPHMKAGLWRQTQQITSSGAQLVDGPRTTKEVCYADHSLAPERHGMCKRFALGRTADGAFVADSECANFGAISRARLIERGDFGANYTSVGWIELSRAGELLKTRIVGHEQLQYLGACPAGMKAH